MNDFVDKIKNYDWRRMKRLTSDQMTDDLNRFLEALPQNVGQVMISFVAAAWIFAGATGLYTMVQLQNLSELRAELEASNAVKPNVPEISTKPMPNKQVKDLAEILASTYRDLDIQASGSGVTISADTTAYFGLFREAIGYVREHKSGIRTNIHAMCVGRECEKKPLSVTLKVNTIGVD